MHARAQGLGFSRRIYKHVGIISLRKPYTRQINASQDDNAISFLRLGKLNKWQFNGMSMMKKTNPMQMMSQFPRKKDSKSGSKRGNLLGEESSRGGDAVIKRMRQKLQQNTRENGSNNGKLQGSPSRRRNSHLEAEKWRTLLPQEHSRNQYSIFITI